MSSISHTGSISLVIPIYNEESMLPLLIREVEAFRKSREERIGVILVDDGSTDSTASLARSLTSELRGYTLVAFTRNFGHQLAVTAGIEVCTDDAAIVMDADLQDPLDVAGKMIDAWHEGFDVVYGVRTKRNDVGWFQRLTARLYYRFFRSFTGVEAPVDAGDFRLLSRKVMKAYRQLGEQQPYVRGLIAWLGFNQKGIEYVRPGRLAGSTKYPWRRRFELALDGIASFSGKPLRYAMRMGLAVSAGSIVGLIWVLFTKYVFQTAITGWASLIFVAFFFGGLQLFFLGVLGSYLARVYDEVKGRPRYVIQEIWLSGNETSGSIQEDDELVTPTQFTRFKEE